MASFYFYNYLDAMTEDKLANFNEQCASESHTESVAYRYCLWDIVKLLIHDEIFCVVARGKAGCEELCQEIEAYKN